MRSPWRWVALAVLAALAVGGGLADGATGGTGVPSCALGSASPAEARVEATVLGQAETRYEATLHGLSAAGRRAAGARYATDLAAYLYGYPIVIQRRTITSYPRNTMVSVGELANTNQQSIVAPNHDTLYSVAQLDLSGGPIVITTPPTGGRYSVIQLLDAFTNVPAYLGDGTYARTGEQAVIVPPGYHGSLPAGLVVIRPASKLVLLLGRTLATGTADTAAAVALLKRYSVTPLAAYEAGTRTGPLVLATFPKRSPIEVPTGSAFFDELNSDLAADPPPAADHCALDSFAAAGAPDGVMVYPDPLQLPYLSAAAANGRSVLNAVVAGVQQILAPKLDGWASEPADTGRFGTHYLDRAVVAATGLEANTSATALYLTQNHDSTSRALNGAHTYRVRFKPGQLPPVSAFWSLTLYDSRILFYANPLNRYSIGDRTTGLKRDHDGGLTIIVSHRAPPAAEQANWLPAPDGPFSLYLRLYEPKSAAVDGRWLPPPVVLG